MHTYIEEHLTLLQVNREDTATGRDHPVNQFTIDFSDDLDFCDRKALLKSSETLSFLVRDAAHITPLNFESCIHAIRAFVEASLNGGMYSVSVTSFSSVS